MNWFRFYTNALDNPKVQNLPPTLFKVWVNLLCIARLNDGVIPPDPKIAFRLRMSQASIGTASTKLIDAGLLDVTDGGLIPHDWERYQYESDTSSPRVKRFRERKRNVSETFQKRYGNGFSSESVSVSDSLSVNLTKKQELKPGIVSQKFNTFWDRWVELTGRSQKKSYACQAFVSVVESDTEIACLACLERYGASDEVQEGKVTNPDKWLYQQAKDAFKGTWQKRAAPQRNGIVAEVERYFNEHPD